MIKENGKVQAQLNTAWGVTDSLVGFTIPQSKSNQNITKEKQGKYYKLRKRNAVTKTF